MFEKFAHILRLRLQTTELHRQKSSLMKKLGEQTYGSLKVENVNVDDLKPIITKIDEVSSRIELANHSLHSIRSASSK